MRKLACTRSLHIFRSEPFTVGPSDSPPRQLYLAYRRARDARPLPVLTAQVTVLPCPNPDHGHHDLLDYVLSAALEPTDQEQLEFLDFLAIEHPETALAAAERDDGGDMTSQAQRAEREASLDALGLAADAGDLTARAGLQELADACEVPLHLVERAATWADVVRLIRGEPAVVGDLPAPSRN
jgi:hypothetical protein